MTGVTTSQIVEPILDRCERAASACDPLQTRVYFLNLQMGSPLIVLGFGGSVYLSGILGSPQAINTGTVPLWVRYVMGAITLASIVSIPTCIVAAALNDRTRARLRERSVEFDVAHLPGHPLVEVGRPLGRLEVLRTPSGRLCLKYALLPRWAASVVASGIIAAMFGLSVGFWMALNQPVFSWGMAFACLALVLVLVACLGRYCSTQWWEFSVTEEGVQVEHWWRLPLQFRIRNRRLILRAGWVLDLYSRSVRIRSGADTIRILAFDPGPVSVWYSRRLFETVRRFVGPLVGEPAKR